MKFLWPYIKAHKGKAFGSVLFSFALAGIKFGEAYLVKPIFDHGLAKDSSFDQVLSLVLMLLALGVINFPCRFFHFYWIRFVVDQITCDIRSNIYSKLQRLPISYYGQSKQGALMSRMLYDTQTFSAGFKASVDLIREPLTALCMFGLALYRDVQLTLVIVVAAPLFAFIFSKSGKNVRRHQGDVQEEMANMSHNISEGISGQKVIKSFNLQDYVLSRFKLAQEAYFKAQMKTSWVEEFAHPLVELIGALAFCGVILFAHKRIASGSMSTGDFVSFITALALLMDPIRKYSQANVKLNQAIAAGNRIFELFSIPEEVDAGRFVVQDFKHHIQVENLSFSYGEKDVLKNLSLNIKKGQKVAFVGLSGSGKSTLINLLLGLYPVTKGQIKIDDVDIKDISLKSLRGLFGSVGQDLFLFHDSIKENLRLGREFEQKQIEQALEVAYAHGFVSSLAQNIETVIGDRGAKLSGGQQQRLTIARAYLQHAPIMLFDEATASLDNESEKEVQKALDNLSGDKTVIAVAHRLSTIQAFDQIFVMREGKLIEQGTHKELLERQGEYAKLYVLGSER